jgi:Flp pilus assembly protein TadD
LYNNVARLLATWPDASLRNGPRAVELAQRAVQLSGGREPLFIATLGAAYAEAGRFPEAIAAAGSALELARLQGNAGLFNAVQAQIALYKSGLPYHQQLR